MAQATLQVRLAEADFEFVSPTADIETYLQLMCAASEPYDTFVFDDVDATRMVYQRLWERQVGDVAKSIGIVLTHEGNAVGVLSSGLASDIRNLRAQAAVAIADLACVASNEGLARRAGLATRAMWTFRPDDYYLSRIAVAEGYRGTGAADVLMDECLMDAEDNGAGRCVLEVGAHNDRAIGFYRRHGFVGHEPETIDDPASGRTVAYLRMEVPIRGGG